MKKTINTQNLEKWAKNRSLEDVEKEFSIFVPDKIRKHRRFGYPKSKYYNKLITKKNIDENRKMVNKFLGIEKGSN